MKVRDIIRLIEADGWRLERTRGSHRQFKHPDKTGIVTVAGHPSVDMPPGTLNNVLKQAGLKGPGGQEQGEAGQEAQGDE